MGTLDSWMSISDGLLSGPFRSPQPLRIFSKVSLVQMGGVLRYKLEAYCSTNWRCTAAFRIFPKLRSQRGTALQMGVVLRYKLEVYRQYFSDKLCGLGVPKQFPFLDIVH